jgi:RNA polymerase sigma factor (sigma-70 family)
VNDGVSDDEFVAHRSLLFTVAYEMLGSAVEAEDVVQETWLRWVAVDQREVQHPRAYLVRIAARQALNRLRSVARRREDYVGEWLPEPLETGPDVAADVELVESVSIAMLTLLETLASAERVVFVLREVFDTPYDEIAEVVGKSPAAVRQIAHRAREHVAARRPRMRVGPAEQLAVVESFMAAVTTGEVQALMALLAPEVVMIADGGGVIPSVRTPVTGSQRVAALLARLAEVVDLRATITWFNGTPGLRLDVDHNGDRVAVAIDLVVEAAGISRIHAINNPHKLGRLGTVVELRR